jgi:hypothetical protein
VQVKDSKVLKYIIPLLILVTKQNSVQQKLGLCMKYSKFLVELSSGKYSMKFLKDFESFK